MHTERAQQQEVINGLLTMLSGGRESFKLWPTIEDGDGEAWFQCPFCKGIGLFPHGNGGVGHTRDCALTLALRLATTSHHTHFDELAYKSIEYQLAGMEHYPHKQRAGTWTSYCPFCTECKEGTLPIAHTKTCIVTVAREHQA